MKRKNWSGKVALLDNDENKLKLYMKTGASEYGVVFDTEKQEVRIDFGKGNDKEKQAFIKEVGIKEEYLTASEKCQEHILRFSKSVSKDLIANKKNKQGICLESKPKLSVLERVKKEAKSIVNNIMKRNTKTPSTSEGKENPSKQKRTSQLG